jgi:CheY-like chemotaxis protein/KaiC/GvpD/RAD55 family RecA-like ATPase
MEKILIIDDEPSARRLIRGTLAKDFEIIEATDGEQGLKKAIEEKPDLVIADILMPLKDGYQLASELRGSPKTRSIPIIMLTGLREEKDELRAFQQGVDDYIVKPIRAPLLRARVAALLARTRALSGKADTELPRTEPASTKKTSCGYPQLDKALDGGLSRGANVLLVGETGSGKSALCRRFLSVGLRNSESCMMIALEDEPLMIRKSLDNLLPKSVTKYEEQNRFRLVDGYSWSKGVTGSTERFSVSGSLELNQLAGTVSDAGQEIGQSQNGKSGGCRVFDSISSLFLNFELATVQRFVAQLARTAASFGGVTTLFVVDEGAVATQTLNNIRYIMDGSMETKVEGDRYYARVSNMKWSGFSKDWVELT